MPFRSQFKTNEEYNEYFRKYRARNAEKLRAYNREYNKQWRKDNGYHNEINSKDRYPEKEHARRMLRYAVKSGDVVKLVCQQCQSVKSQAHHLDYSKPLDVIWLCALCHRKLHKTVENSTNISLT